jgi:hypothetical protein
MYFCEGTSVQLQPACLIGAMPGQPTLASTATAALLAPSAALLAPSPSDDSQTCMSSPCLSLTLRSRVHTGLCCYLPRSESNTAAGPVLPMRAAHGSHNAHPFRVQVYEKSCSYCCDHQRCDELTFLNRLLNSCCLCSFTLI